MRFGTCFAAFALFAIVACSPKSGKPVYTPVDGSFSCEVPGDWRVLENQGGAHRVSFYGPGGSAVNLYFYDKSRFSSVREYYLMESVSGATLGPLHEEKVGDRSLSTFTAARATPKLHSIEIENLSEQTYIIPAAGGFYSIMLVAPVSSVESVRPAFLDLVRSFKARG